MNAEFWPVGAPSSQGLPMKVADISTHLLTDWVPSLPVSVSSSFVGWPPYLIDSIPLHTYKVLSLAKVAGRSERQWKGFLSWMLGVAGTRHVLANEKYRWIAPLSAFYEDAVQDVDLSRWPSLYLPGALSASRPANSKLRLRPDYVAIRSSAGATVLDWAVAESKGTRRSLAKLPKCPLKWYNQARNIELAVNGKPLTVQRHLVVATRVNPNGERPTTRRIQIRAWNSNSAAESGLPPEAFLEVATAHLFGVFRNLRLHDNAQAIAWAPWRLNYVDPDRVRATGPDRRELVGRAQIELQEFVRRPQSAPDSGLMFVQSDAGSLEAELAGPLMRLVAALQNARSSSQAVRALTEADIQLDELEQQHGEEQTSELERRLPIGLTLRFPERRSL